MTTSTDARARPLAIVSLVATAALFAVACAPPPAPDPGPPGPERVDFDSAGVLTLSADYGPPGEPAVTSTDFELQATGAWLVGDLGILYVNLELDDVELVTDDSPIGDGSVVLSGVQNGPAIGVFDPSTGLGGFGTELTLTVESIDDGSGPVAIDQPCDVGVGLQLSGGIDLASGELDVIDTDAVFTPMADDDCGGLGAVLAPALLGNDQTGQLVFEVGTP